MLLDNRVVCFKVSIFILPLFGSVPSRQNSSLTLPAFHPPAHGNRCGRCPLDKRSWAKSWMRCLPGRGGVLWIWWWWWWWWWRVIKCGISSPPPSNRSSSGYFYYPSFYFVCYQPSSVVNRVDLNLLFLLHPILLPPSQCCLPPPRLPRHCRLQRPSHAFLGHVARTKTCPRLHLQEPPGGGGGGALIFLRLCINPAFLFSPFLTPMKVVFSTGGHMFVVGGQASITVRRGRGAEYQNWEV